MLNKMKSRDTVEGVWREELKIPHGNTGYTEDYNRKKSQRRASDKYHVDDLKDGNKLENQYEHARGNTASKNSQRRSSRDRFYSDQLKDLEENNTMEDRHEYTRGRSSQDDYQHEYTQDYNGKKSQRRTRESYDSREFKHVENKRMEDQRKYTRGRSADPRSQRKTRDREDSKDEREENERTKSRHNQVRDYAGKRSQKMSMTKGIYNTKGLKDSMEENGRIDRQEGKSSKVVIENRFITDSTNNGVSGGSLMSCLTSRRSMIIIGIYLFISTGALFYLLSGKLKIPGLEGQIAKLEGQVEKLDGEIIELESQVERFSTQVDRLKNETDVLSGLNDRLRDTVNDLNMTVTHLSEQNPILEGNLENYEALNRQLDNSLQEANELNSQLSSTVVDLQNDLTTLNDINDDLSSTVSDLDAESKNFVAIIGDLQEQNNDLDGRIDSLETEVENLREQNSFLSDNNDDLVSIMAFLTEASINLNTTSDAVAHHLADDIRENSFLLLQDLQLHYQNTFTLWTCFSSFDFLYGDKPWAEDEGIAIGSDDYPDLIEFLKENVLDKICADKNDFEQFLVSDPVIGYSGTSPPVDITFNELSSGLQRYATRMMDYYFTSEGEDGLSDLDWTNAGYDCKGLEDDLIFEW